jgi:hypothetical protein
MQRRWHKPPPPSPQSFLPLPSRSAHAPKPVTDTSFAAGVSIGALVSAGLGAIRKARDRRMLAGLALAATVRDEVRRHLEQIAPAGATADELAGVLKHSPFTTRPRCTELRAMGLIRDSGDRRLNSSGRRAIVWAIAQSRLG